MLTDLHKAVLNGDVENVESLLQRGGNMVNRTNTNGETALHIASFEGHKDIVQRLIENHANTQTLTNMNHTALHYACIKGHAAIPKLLIAATGTDVNVRDNEGMTALHHSAKKGSSELVALLLEHGADIWAIDNNGMTVLHVAAMRGNQNVARVLVDKEPSLLSHSDYQNRKPLHLAVGNPEVSNYLVGRELTLKCEELRWLIKNSVDSLNDQLNIHTKMCDKLEKRIKKTTKQQLVHLQINTKMENSSATTGNRNNNQTNPIGEKAHSETAQNDEMDQEVIGSSFKDPTNVSLLLIMCLAHIIIKMINDKKTR